MFVFPMLGRSTRFFNAGFTVPKYKLPLGREGQVVFDHVLGSFRRYFESDMFVFICRLDTSDKAFLTERLHALGVRQFEVIEHQGETRGQAESVELGLKGVPDDKELFIFNIDTVLYDFEKDPCRGDVAGYLEVFKGQGNHWSFVEPSTDNTNRTSRVVEKERISDLCSNGLYFFNTKRTFKSALDAYRAKHTGTVGELYVAPLYNELIELGMPVTYKLISADRIGFCGVPDEYGELYRALHPN